MTRYKVQAPFQLINCGDDYLISGMLSISMFSKSILYYIILDPISVGIPCPIVDNITLDPNPKPYGMLKLIHVNLPYCLYSFFLLKIYHRKVTEVKRTGF